MATKDIDDFVDSCESLRGLTKLDLRDRTFCGDLDRWLRAEFGADRARCMGREVTRGGRVRSVFVVLVGAEAWRLTPFFVCMRGEVGARTGLSEASVVANATSLIFFFDLSFDLSFVFSVSCFSTPMVFSAVRIFLAEVGALMAS